MSGQPIAEPVIVKKKKVVSGDGHHGGAWKVAISSVPFAPGAFAPKFLLDYEQTESPF